MSRRFKYLVGGLIMFAVSAPVVLTLVSMQGDESRHQRTAIVFLLCVMFAVIRLSLVAARILSHLKTGKPLRPQLRGFGFLNRSSHYIDRRQKARRERVARNRTKTAQENDDSRFGD